MDVTGIGAAADLVKTIVSRVWPDKSAEEQAQIAAVLQSQKAQTDVDQVEAGQPGMHFRDGAGWVCVAAFALAALRAPIEWGCAMAGHPITLPSPDTSLTNDMLLGLLGLGSMHVYQSVKGAS